MREAVSGNQSGKAFHRRLAGLSYGVNKVKLLSGVCAGAILIAAILASPASAVDTWTGTTSNDWTVGSNWQDSTAPTSTDPVNINSAANSPVLGVNGAATGTVSTINVGAVAGSTGVLTIQNGSTLTSVGSSRIATVNPSTGIVTVTGAGSQWLINGNTFYVGWLGNGTLNIQDGGRVFVTVGTVLGANSSSSGTVNVDSGGTLETGYLRGGTGGSQANFDNGILKATGNNATFINGFSGTELNLLAGGLTIDTNGFDVGTDATSGFTGTGGLTITGGGVFSLLADSTYAGETSIEAGSALALQGAGAIESSSRVVADGAFDVSGMTATGTSIQSLAGSGAVTLGAKTLTITNADDLFSGIISGSGGLTLTGGTQTLSGANDYTGATTVDGGTLEAGAADAFSAASAFTIAAGSTLNLAGFDQIIASLNNAGALRLSDDSSAGTTLTVTGDYEGDGGTVYVNTVLGDDTSTTDLLDVEGDTSGTSSLVVTNVGGTGAQTVEGIKVVNVDGNSDGTFSLVGDYVYEGDQAVIAGAYAYQLFQGSTSLPDDGDWYLRSIGFSPTTSVLEALPNLFLGLATAPAAPTLRQRAGLRYFDWADGSGAGLPVGEDTSDPLAGSAYSRNLWTRIEGAHGHFEGESSTSLEYDLDTWLMQVGFDGLLADTGSGLLVGGLNFAYAKAVADISSDVGDGSVDAESYSLGATLTWYGAGGFYVDGQANVAYQIGDADSDLAGEIADDIDGWSYGLSLEAGKKIGIGGNWSLTPQAQLAYTTLDFDKFEDNFGSEIGLEGDSLKGRVGVALDFDSMWNARGDKGTFYAIVNVTYEFLDGTSADISGTEVGFDPDHWGGELGIGGTYAWAGGKYALHGEALAQSSFEGSYGYKGTAGFRVNW